MRSRAPRRADDAAIRILDLLGAAIGTIVLSPLMLAVALAVKLTSPGPALFRSVRLGRNHRPFALYKFRSMVDRAPEIGAAITAAEDPRITPLGSILRKYKIDELPQLINVLVGEMSLVGPRPEDPAYVARYSRDQLEILQAKPGMTSPASLRYRDEESSLTGNDWERHYIETVMPTKLAIDREYVSRRTCLSDLKVVISTFARLAGL